MNGWWKFHRAMFDHAVCRLPLAHRWVWITILCHANHKESDWWNGTERVAIPAGSFITSQDHLASLADVTRKQIRGAIKGLIQCGSISAKSRAKRYTEICVINWSSYQGTDVEEGQVEGQVRANKGPSKGQVRAITEECKKERRKERILLANPEGFASFWLGYPKKLGKANAEKAWNKIAPQNGLVEVIIASVEAHKRTWTDPQFIPYPATFLNGRRWEDILVQADDAAPVDPKLRWKTRENYQAARQAGRVKPGEIPEWEPTTSDPIAVYVPKKSNPPGGATTAAPTP